MDREFRTPRNAPSTGSLISGIVLGVLFFALMATAIATMMSRPDVPVRTASPQVQMTTPSVSPAPAPEKSAPATPANPPTRE